MIFTKRIYNKINYKVKLPLEFEINVLTPSKNHVRYTVEDKGIVRWRTMLLIIG